MAVRKTIAECDGRLSRFKAALDAGAGPVEVTQWINAAKLVRAHAEGELRGLPTGRRMTGQEINAMISAEVCIRRTTTVSVVFLALIAAVVSFGHMHELALRV